MVNGSIASQVSATPSDPRGLTISRQLKKETRPVAVAIPKTPAQLRAELIAKETTAVDTQIDFQQSVIDKIKAVIATRNAELRTAEGSRHRTLTDRNDRDADRINDINRTIKNLQASRSRVGSEITAASLIRQSQSIAEVAEKTRAKRRADGTTLQAERRDQRIADEAARLERIADQELLKNANAAVSIEGFDLLKSRAEGGDVIAQGALKQVKFTSSFETKEIPQARIDALVVLSQTGGATASASAKGTLSSLGVTLPTDPIERRDFFEDARGRKQARDFKATKVAKFVSQSIFTPTKNFLSPKLSKFKEVATGTPLIGLNFNTGGFKSTFSLAEIGGGIATGIGKFSPIIARQPILSSRRDLILGANFRSKTTIGDAFGFFGKEASTPSSVSFEASKKEFADLSTGEFILGFQDDPVKATKQLLNVPFQAAKRQVFSPLEQLKSDVKGTSRVIESSVLLPTPVKSVVSLGLRGSAELIPSTPVGQTALVLGARAFPRLPLAPQLGLTGAITASSLSTVLSTSLDVSAEQRVGAGIIAGLGTAGLLSRATPFVKGAFARGGQKTALGETVFREGFRSLLSNKKTRFVRTRLTNRNLPRSSEQIKVIPAGGAFSEGSSPKLKVNVNKLAKKFAKDLKLQKNPKLPKTKGLQKEIVNLLKGRDEVVTGSFSGAGQLKNQGTKLDSRGFFKKDLDIISANQKSTAAFLKSKLGSRIKITPQAITDSPLGKFKVLKIFNRKTGKLLGDIDPIKFAEEGLALGSKPRVVQGLKLLRPEVRLEAKLSQLARGKVGVLQKTARDIKLTTGGELDIGAGVTGGFRRSFSEQLGQAGKKAKVTASASDFFKDFLGVKSNKPVKLSKELFGTPSAITDPALVRESRLNLFRGFFKKPDARTGFTFRRNKPQVIIQQAKIGTGKFSVKQIAALVKKADAGDKAAANKLFAISKSLKGEKGFTISTQPRGELEVRANIAGTSVKKLSQGRSIRIRGQAVEVFRAELQTGKAEPGVAKLLKLSRDKGFQSLTGEQQSILTGSLSRQTGLDVSRILSPATFVSPSGFASGSLGLPRLGKRNQALVSRKLDTRRQDLVFRSPRAARRPKARPVRRPLTTQRLPTVPRLAPIVRQPVPIRRPPTPVRRPPTTTRRPPIIPKDPTRFLPPPIIPSKKRSRRVQGFLVEERRGGIFKPLIGKAVSRSEAIRIGAKRASTTLARTFRLRQTKSSVAESTIRTAPNLNQFRRFKISQGRRIPLTNVFIQKAKSSLSSRGEVKEIQKAKKKKDKKKQSIKKQRKFGIL